MKNTLYIAALLIGASATPALAADDFGAPFTNQTPIGFSDVKPNEDAFNIEDFDPNAIEPAAGDEEPAAPDAKQDQDVQQAPETEEAAPEEISL